MKQFLWVFYYQQWFHEYTTTNRNTLILLYCELNNYIRMKWKFKIMFYWEMTLNFEYHICRTYTRRALRWHIYIFLDILKLASFHFFSEKRCQHSHLHVICHIENYFSYARYKIAPYGKLKFQVIQYSSVWCSFY